KNDVIQQDSNIVTFVNIFAHFYIIPYERRKRRGIEP
ncbi:MAG: hypothetical protein UX39_C0019G0001, partial [Candidatus Magasanikbacteria bacterium GW2011_GWA2_46_17]